MDEARERPDRTTPPRGVLRHHRVMAYGVAILTMALMVWPVPQPPELTLQFLDKWTHVLLFLLVGASFLLTMTEGLTVWGRRLLIRGTVYALVFGLVCESVQGILPWRFFEALDLTANTIGVLVASAAFFLCQSARGRGGG